MSKNSPSKDGTLEVLDFILNVIEEHDKDLDTLTTELGSIVKRQKEMGELSDKFARIKDKMDTLQKDINKIVKILSLSPDRIKPSPSYDLSKSVEKTC